MVPFQLPGGDRVSFSASRRLRWESRAVQSRGARSMNTRGCGIFLKRQNRRLKEMGEIVNNRSRVFGGWGTQQAQTEQDRGHGELCSSSWKVFISFALGYCSPASPRERLNTGQMSKTGKALCRGLFIELHCGCEMPSRQIGALETLECIESRHTVKDKNW